MKAYHGTPIFQEIALARQRQRAERRRQEEIVELERALDYATFRLMVDQLLSPDDQRDLQVVVERNDRLPYRGHVLFLFDGYRYCMTWNDQRSVWRVAPDGLDPGRIFECRHRAGLVEGLARGKG